MLLLLLMMLFILLGVPGLVGGGVIDAMELFLGRFLPEVLLLMLMLGGFVVLLFLEAVWYWYSGSLVASLASLSSGLSFSASITAAAAAAAAAVVGVLTVAVDVAVDVADADADALFVLLCTHGRAGSSSGGLLLSLLSSMKLAGMYGMGGYVYMCQLSLAQRCKCGWDWLIGQFITVERAVIYLFVERRFCDGRL